MQNTLFFINYKALQSILILIFVFAPVNSFGHSSNDHAEEEVNVYSGRKGKLIEPMLKKFENKIRSKSLLKKSESKNAPIKSAYLELPPTDQIHEFLLISFAVEFLILKNILQVVHLHHF